MRHRFGQCLRASPTVFGGRPACFFSILMIGGLLLGDAQRSAAQEIPIPPQETPIPSEGTLIPPQETVQGDQAPAAIARDPGRACEGCPPRRVGTSLLQTTGINVIYELANWCAARSPRITPKTWWTNMQQGMVWDLDDFTVNQIGHPYQGNNYFNAGRANGLGFYESAAVTAFGSATWEFFGETNHPSLNDFINTTLGGITLGEMFHRTGWLIRNTQATGKRRLWSEIGALAVDPIRPYPRGVPASTKPRSAVSGRYAHRAPFDHAVEVTRPGLGDFIGESPRRPFSVGACASRVVAGHAHTTVAINARIRISPATSRRDRSSRGGHMQC